MVSEEILVSVDSDDYTLGQIMQMVNQYQDEHPDMEVYLDGDRRAYGHRFSHQHSLAGDNQ